MQGKVREKTGSCCRASRKTGRFNMWDSFAPCGCCEHVCWTGEVLPGERKKQEARQAQHGQAKWKKSSALLVGTGSRTGTALALQLLTQVNRPHPQPLRKEDRIKGRQAEPEGNGDQPAFPHIPSHSHFGNLRPLVHTEGWNSCRSSFLPPHLSSPRPADNLKTHREIL